MALTETVRDILIGAAAGVAGDKVKGKINEHLPHVEDDWEKFIADFPQKFDAMCKDLHDLAHAATLVPELSSANLFAYPAEQVLNYKGRQHISIFCTSSFPVRLFVANVGAYQPTLVAGWNALDVPEGSTIALPQGVSGLQLVMIMASDTSLGNAI